MSTTSVEQCKSKIHSYRKSAKIKRMFSSNQGRFVFLINTLIYLLSMITFQREDRPRFAQGGLIEIYNKYRSLEPTALNNQDNSTIQLASRNSEYASPMKRIMDIINQHSPLIVVSSDSSGIGSSQDQHAVSNQNQDSKQLSSKDAASNSAQSSQISTNLIDQQQAWAPVEVLSPTMGNQMSAQPQQLVQSSVPYEHYYLDPGSFITQPNLASSTVSGQIALLSPANLAFHPPSAGYQQVATIPYPAAESQLQPQPMMQPMPATLDDRAQPIFLSSYIPEIPAHLMKPQVGSSMQPQPLQQRPDSIQQVQLTQQVQGDAVQQPTKSPPAQSNPEPQSKSSESSEPKQSQNNDEPDDPAPNTGPSGDIEEAGRKRQVNSNSDDSDEPASTNGGSVSFEDKYDSDRDDGPRSGSSSHKNSNVGHEQLAAASNGLVNVGLNDDCLQCICRASSGCDHLLRCITRGSEDKYCGPFQLTEEYWNKAGSPGDQASNFISFEDCANDADCAVETVTNYMKKYHKDCDGDENITCMDYARLHRLAPNECDNTDKLVNHFDAYWAKFQRCAEGYNRSRNGDDEEI